MDFFSLDSRQVYAAPSRSMPVFPCLMLLKQTRLWFYNGLLLTQC